ncbi:MAG: hypothetical protein SPF67_04100 [Eubacteriales bacterium]|nr:hypothetical protein [Eubacterium sp.]MDY5493722.1 hypothetical protein [Eubacteriales bacterium]
MFPENDIIFTSVWPWILIAVSVGLTVLEALMKKRAIFALVSAVFTAASAVVLLILGGSLCDMLLLVIATLAVRLLFEIIERRRAK